MREEITQATEQTDDIAALIGRLQSRRARARARARRALVHRGAEALPAIRELLEAESARRRRRRPLQLAYAWAIFGLYILLQCNLFNPLAWGLIPVLGLLFIGLARLCSVTPVQVEAIRTLAAIDDVRAVGPLLEALEWRDLASFTGVQSLAAQSLSRLLPRLRQEDADLLDDRQRACLYRLLRHHPSDDQTELILALLSAVAKVGDTRAVAHLERMTLDVRGGPPRQRVRRSAQEALALLRERLGSAPRTLLRASSSTPANEYLRPVNTASPSTDPSQLLRPSQNESDS